MNIPDDREKRLVRKQFTLLRNLMLVPEVFLIEHRTFLRPLFYIRDNRNPLIHALLKPDRLRPDR